MHVAWHPQLGMGRVLYQKECPEDECWIAFLFYSDNFLCKTNILRAVDVGNPFFKQRAEYLFAKNVQGLDGIEKMETLERIRHGLLTRNFGE